MADRKRHLPARHSLSEAGPELATVLESAARLQEAVPDAVLVGGSAAALYARHRDSFDHDLVLADLRDRFDMVLEAIESEDGWVTNRVTPGKIILDRLGDTEAGVGQMIRARAWETATVLTHSRPYGVAELMERVIARARDRAVAAERAAVADEICRAIERAKMTRAQLAVLLGASASRLSTYASGRVTPSAAFMVRLRRTIERLP